MNFQSIIKSAGNWISKHSPELLVAVGIAGFGASVVSAVTVTPKAKKVLKKIEKENEDAEPKEVGMAIIKEVVPMYLPAAALFLASSACVIFSNRISDKRKTAAVAAYKVTEEALRQYSNVVEEKIGARENRKLKKKAAIKKEEVQEKKNMPQTVIIGKGDILCYDTVSKRYFTSNAAKIEKAVNKLSRTMLSERYVSLNDFNYEIGLEMLNYGDDIGWNVDRGFIDIMFSSKLTDDNEPCLVIDYLVEPKKDYMF